MREWSPFTAYGNRKKSFLSGPDALLAIVLSLAGVWIFFKASTLGAYRWDWGALADFIVITNKSGDYEPGLLIRGLFTTIRVGLWTILFSFILGGLTGILATRVSFPVVFIIQVYVNIIRNTPPLVFIFCVYFFASGIMPVGAMVEAIRSWPESLRWLFAAVFAPPGQLDRMISAILALGIYQGAYVTEIVRAGIQSVPLQQWDAASALGFSQWQTILWIILPQAGRLCLPPLAGQALTTFKDSALASLISLPDLTFQSLEIMAVSQLTFEIWIACGLLYLLIGLVCSIISRRLEKRYAMYHF